MKEEKEGTERAWIEIDLGRLEHNAGVLQRAMPPGCKLMAVVKAGAYGHGALEVSARLGKTGVDAFAVATIDEGIELRKYGIRGDILILGYTSVRRAADLRKYDLTQTLIDFDYAEALNGQGISVKAHIKIDTGMHRLGIDCGDPEKVRRVFAMENIEICGIYTHLCRSDSLEPEAAAFTKEQIGRFYSLIGILKAGGITIPKIHIQSSYGLLNYPYLACDYVRAGIALYGVLSSPGDETVLKLDLRPVLSLRSRVILIRRVRRGDSAGYGGSFRAKRDSLLAILPIGYGDGLPRSLSCQNGGVSLNGYYAPIAGRICMDQLAVDITDAGDVAVGDTATLIVADEGCVLSAPDVAERSGSISNELLCRLGGRLPVIVEG